VAGGTGWWVKTSDVQNLNKAGLPCGFKHTLMHGNKTVKSGHGVGVDAGRTLRALAEFSNAREQSLMTVTAKRTLSHPEMPILRQDGSNHDGKEGPTTETNH